MVQIISDPNNPAMRIICVGDQPIATFPTIGQYVTLHDIETIVNNALTAWERSWH